MFGELKSKTHPGVGICPLQSTFRAFRQVFPDLASMDALLFGFLIKSAEEVLRLDQVWGNVHSITPTTPINAAVKETANAPAIPTSIM
jgi:hypothetical protein